MLEVVIMLMNKPRKWSKGPDKSLVVFLGILLSGLILLPVSSSYGQTKSGWLEEKPKSQENASAHVDAKSGSVTLKIGVQHSTHIEPIPMKLQTGSIFDERILKVKKRLNWYPIPEWLAGKWQRKSERILSTHNYLTNQTVRMNKTIMSEQIADWGVQRDKKGDIWNCNLSSRGASNRGSYRSVALVRKQIPVKNNRLEIVFKEQFVVLHVMKGTNAIMDSYIVESITRYKPVKRGLIETAMSVQVYTADGTPKTRQENVSVDRLIKPYTSVDSYKGKDVHADFNRFLRSQNLEDLIVD